MVVESVNLWKKVELSAFTLMETEVLIVKNKFMKNICYFSKCGKF